MIHHGDCLDVLPTLLSDSVDAIVTDPPAGIAFMSKHWDRDKGGRTEWVAWMTQVMRECYRVLKPGGYAVVWSLPRTCHWTAWAMEDAGFIIRDQLAHIFASGFPKGKAQLKPAREDWWLARKPGPLLPLNIDDCRIGMSDADAANIDSKHAGMDLEAYQRPAGHSLNLSEHPMPLQAAKAHASGRWPSNLLLSDPALFDEPNPEVVGSGAVTNVPGTYARRDGNVDYDATSYKAGLPVQEGYGDSGGYSRFFRIPSSAEEAAREDDFTPLPSEDTVVCEWCGCPIHLDEGVWTDTTYRSYDSCPEGLDVGPTGTSPHKPSGLTDYPTHFIIPKAGRSDREPVLRGQLERTANADWPQSLDGNDVRGASPRENAHPTVKPVDLMRHLVRLVTPPGGTVLDCFLGSGTTAIAAELEGFPWIGIEQDASYVAIAEARLNGTQRGLGLDVPAPTRKMKGGPGYWPEERNPHDDETRTTYLKGGFRRGTFPDEEPAA